MEMSTDCEGMDDRLKIIEKAWSVSGNFSREKEFMLYELISFYGKAITKEDKSQVINCFSKLNSSQHLFHDAITALVEFLINYVEDLLDGHVLVTNQIVNIPSFKHHLKQNERKCIELFQKIVSCQKQYDGETELVNNLLSIGLSTEKGQSSFLKKAYLSLAQYSYNLEMSKNNNDAQTELLQIVKTLFNKTGCQKLKQTFQACFEDVDEVANYSALFQSLYNCFSSDLNNNVKAAYFKLIFQALLTTAQLDDAEMLKFFLIVSYLLGIPSTDFIDGSRINSKLGINPTKNDSSLPVWASVLEVIAKRPLTLSLEVNETSFSQWLKSVTAAIIKAENFGTPEVKVLTALAYMDSSIIEHYLSKIFGKILDGEFLDNEERRKSYEEFLLSALRIFSRLQRTNKFLKKLLSAIAAKSSSGSTHYLLSKEFLNQLGKNSLVLSSSQALNLIHLLMDEFQKSCSCLQNDQLNAGLLDTVSILFCTVMANCRLICSSLPRSAVEQFTQNMDQLKDSLGEFGTIILQRPHDRKIMQPYLRMCHVWGEYHVLTDLYALEIDAPILAIDATPSDLSPILPFLKGEQWSILSERIANFGDNQCNKLLMKLLILKIRIAYVSAANSSINLEAIAKGILETLKQNVHGLIIDESMSPEEFGFVFNALPLEKAQTLVKILYGQLISSHDVIFKRWIKNNILLENPKFVEIAFETIIKDISESVERKDLQRLLKNVELKSVSEDLKTSINEVLREEGGNNENKLNDRVRKSLAALTSMPFGYIASFGDNSLIIVLGIMVGLKSPRLLPVFAKLLSYSKVLHNCFDISLCIRWLTSHVKDRALRAPVIEQLVIKSTLSQNGVQEFKQIVKNLEKDGKIKANDKIATQVQLHNAIRKVRLKKLHNSLQSHSTPSEHSSSGHLTDLSQNLHKYSLSQNMKIPKI